MIRNAPFEQILQVMFVKRAEGFWRDAITGSAALLRDRRLQPTLFYPPGNLAAAHVEHLRERLHGETVATNLADAQFSPMEGASKSFYASVKLLRNLFSRVFCEQLSRLIQFLLLPAAVIVYCLLDPILDDESPAFLLGAAGLTLEPADKLG
jgi:hypothetical protein